MSTGSRDVPACMAPFKSLYFDPLGDVRACCQNSWYRLGRYPDQRIIDIWQSEAADALRSKLAVGDFSAGCHACRPGSVDDLRGEVFARRFDELLEVPTEQGWPAQLELQLSNTCNLQCTMCTGLQSSAIRSRREGLAPLRSPYDDAFFEQLRPFLQHARRLEFLGGEPFLSSELHRVVGLLDELGVNPTIHVTTNGTVFNRWVAGLLERRHVDVTVSIDGSTPEVFEAIRVGARFAEVISNLDRFIRIAERSGSTVSIATCLMRENWGDLHGLLGLADDRGLDVYVNTVVDPSSSSLIGMPAGELSVVVDSIEQQDREAPLTRNRAVLERELARLRSLAAVSGRATDSDPVATLEAWAAGAGLVSFEADDRQVLRSVTPDASDVFGLDLRPVIGRALATWIEVLRPVYGEIETSSVTRYSNGMSRWDLTIVGPQGGHAMAALCQPQRSGERWLLTMRPLEPTAEDSMPSGDSARHQEKGIRSVVENL